MRIITAVPIVRGVAPDILSYYTGLPVKEGALVEVPVRKKFAPALVVSVTDVKESTSDIRRAAYKLKKVKRLLSPCALPAPVMQTVAYLSRHYAAPLGTVLYAVVPQPVFSSPHFLRLMSSGAPDAPELPYRSPVSILQMPYEERLTRYRSIIRESFAQARSVVLIAPTRAHADDLYERLSKGVEDHAILLASSLSPKQQKERWEKAMTHAGPVLVVGTALSASVWRGDISHYILDHEASAYYKSAQRPFIDGRLLVRQLARHANAHLIFGDTYLRIETLAKAFDHEYEELLKPQMHQQTNAAVTLIDMRETPPVRGEAPVLSPQGEDAVTRSVEENERSFVYATRKGHTPLTLCRDCGTVLVCDRCDAPMVLHSKGRDDDAENRWFECHRCGRIRDAKTVCGVCGGWRLYAYGMGVEKVSELLKTRRKEAPVFLLTGDTAKTHAQALKIVSSWRSSAGGILIGTVRALPYLRMSPPHTSVLASFDTLLMLPDIYTQERLFCLLSFMREVTSRRLIVQTRSPEHETLRQALSGDGLNFFKSENERRKSFLYPPYGTLVKVTLQGKQKDVLSHLEALKERLLPRSVSIYPAFVSKVKNLFVAHALISIPAGAWPDERVAAVLRSLPPAYRVDVEPESLL